ncbi:hypothetical protein WA026_022096 [Henosepilachna vigintioctopunctata]|uniref:Uncharacterized protein n=1 Tax=Henosepilachna vigintioctopunctata TaxID=420089 RepID=A0AAW1U3U5_9CUCU
MLRNAWGRSTTDKLQWNQFCKYHHFVKRWSLKYESISMFEEHFVEALENLSRGKNSGTSEVALQLLSTIGQTTFILA